MSWLVLYLLTVAIEVPLAVLLAPRELRRRTASDAFLLNTLTHPLLTVALHSGWIGFWPGETAVLLVEALGFRLATRLRPGRALLVSTVCNGITVLIAVTLV